MEILLRPQLPVSGQMHMVALLIQDPAQDRKALQGLGLSFPADTFSDLEGKTRLLPFAGMLFWLSQAPDAEPESVRRQVCQAWKIAEEHGMQQLTIWQHQTKETISAWVGCCSEALELVSYRFTPYLSKVPSPNLEKTCLFAPENKETGKALHSARIIAQATCVARDLVNEPANTLTATELGNRIISLGQTYGFQVDVWEKAKISALKMGGLLAVNQGSFTPPTFSVLTHCPTGLEDTPPIILVGKGIVYDTGGLSLKPTANSMDFMKSDMAGAAAVIGAFCALAGLGIKRHVVGLIPATDNRPGHEAFAPGDVIRMYDGTSVEVMNTDAEGRLVLADALAYAKQYKPAVVIDLATLTGAAVGAIGQVGIAMMRKTDETVAQALKEAGEDVYERLVEFPLWREYGEMLKSDIADLKNLGGRYAGAITAGKFLEHFTDYPWIHLDIAGPSFLPAASAYRPKNGTGVGVRLLTRFIQQQAQKE